MRTHNIYTATDLIKALRGGPRVKMAAAVNPGFSTQQATTSGKHALRPTTQQVKSRAMQTKKQKTSSVELSITPSTSRTDSTQSQKPKGAMKSGHWTPGPPNKALVKFIEQQKTVKVAPGDVNVTFDQFMAGYNKANQYAGMSAGLRQKTHEYETAGLSKANTVAVHASRVTVNSYKEALKRHEETESNVDEFVRVHFLNMSFMPVSKRHIVDATVVVNRIMQEYKKCHENEEEEDKEGEEDESDDSDEEVG